MSFTIPGASIVNTAMATSNRVSRSLVPLKLDSTDGAAVSGLASSCTQTK